MKGGTETFHFGLADSLRESGHEVIFFSMKDDRNIPCDEAKYFVNNIDYNARISPASKALLAVKLVYSLEAKKKIRALIEAEKPDVAHISLVHRQLSFSIVDELVSHNIPIVMHLHELSAICPAYTMLRPDGTICEDCVGAHFSNCIRNKCMKNSRAKSILAFIEAEFLRIGNYYNKIDLYIAECDHYRILANKAHFTNSPIIRMNNFLPSQQVYQFHPAPEGYILYYGRFSREKGVLTALAGYSMLEVAPEFHLVGHGPELDTIIQYVSGHQLEDKVTIHPATFGEKMERLIEGARVVVVPSEWYENGAYVVLQALAKGKVVIASDIAGLSEIIEDGVTGFLAEPKNPKSFRDAFQKALSLEGHELEAFSKNAAIYAQNRCDWRSYVKTLTKEYQKLIDHHEV